MPPTVDPRPLSILVAEDNPVNQRLVQAILKHRGHAPTLVASGSEALAALAAGAFDVVLMDLHMPEMDGVAAAAAIRAREAATGAHLPILALTASAGDGDEERCLAAGMDGFITKPVRAEDLIARVETAAGGGARAPEPSPAAAGGGEGLGRKLNGLFIADAARLCDEIRDAVARRDGGALQAAAHRLRGSAGYFAAQRAFELAARLEQRGRESDFDAGTEQLCRELAEELARLDKAVKTV
jgi:CheY-like chemotaxis protein/HPt (histidine-containing phosphotransfer) domain-containing protein